MAFNYPITDELNTTYVDIKSWKFDENWQKTELEGWFFDVNKNIIHIKTKTQEASGNFSIKISY